MAAPNPPDDNALPNDNWGPQDDHSMGPTSNGQGASGQPLSIDDRAVVQDPENPDYPRGSSVGDNDIYREKQIKPNKVYIGGLPEHTRQEDLQNCFGKIGCIVNIELKVGYGFVEFDTREAAEESVSKYHDGYFMGNRIRVELSHGGGRTAKYAGDPGACFKCGELGHWARECPNSGYPQRRQQNYDAPLIDRIQRDYPPPPRSLGPRDDYPGPPRPPRDSRYDYPAAGPIREHRRPPSPREYRDYPPAPARVRDYDDYRRGPPPLDRDRYGPPPPEARGRYPPPDPAYRNYAPPPPPPPPVYDRYDRRPNDRYGYSQPPGPRGRTPPRVRDEYERPQPPPPPPPPATRDYGDYRGRPVSPPRYPPDYGRSGYRRRSESPPLRQGVPYEPYPMNGYGPPAGPPSVSVAPRGSRDYLPPAPTRSRDGVEPGPYRRP